MLSGPVGLLEGELALSEKNSSSIALILPPNPKHKGTMKNKIVNLLFKIFAELEFNTLKINFRGVGLSQGISSANESEIEDALAALDWLIKRCEKSKTKSPKIFVAGYSFGAWISLQCAMRRPEISSFIGLNIPFDKYQFNMLTPCPNGLLLQAQKDHTINFENAEAFASQLITQKGCSIKFESIGSDHYFKNKEKELEHSIKEYIQSILDLEKAA